MLVVNATLKTLSDFTISIKLPGQLALDSWAPPRYIAIEGPEWSSRISTFTPSSGGSDTVRPQSGIWDPFSSEPNCRCLDEHRKCLGIGAMPRQRMGNAVCLGIKDNASYTQL